MNFRRDYARHVAWASAAQSRGDRNVLFAVDRKCDWIALHGRPEPRLPKHLAGLNVDSEEIAVEIADEGHSAGGGEHGREKRGALLDRPVLLQGAHVVGRQFADIAPGARHFDKPAVPRPAARILLELHFTA